MRLTVEPEAISYASERLQPGSKPATCSVPLHARGFDGRARQAGTLEHFLAERYFLYAARHGRLYRGQVHHTPLPASARRGFRTRRDPARRGGDRST